MKTQHHSKIPSVAIFSLLVLGFALPAPAQPSTAAERAAILRATMAASAAVLRQYEWVQTTVITVKDEEKSRKQEHCYYGADGGLQKIEINRTPPPKKKGGLRGHIAKHKQEELTTYMQNAVGLVKTYVPPNSTKIQAAKESGNVSIEVLEPGKRARLNFRNYEKPGDNLGVEVDLTSNRPLSVKVSTYLDDAKDIVTLDVRMRQLDDGTTYASDITLDAKAKDLKVTLQNGGYKKM